MRTIYPYPALQQDSLIKSGHYETEESQSTPQDSQRGYNRAEGKGVLQEGRKQPYHACSYMHARLLPTTKKASAMSKPVMTISFPDYLEPDERDAIYHWMPQEMKDRYNVLILDGGATSTTHNPRLEIATQILSGWMANPKFRVHDEMYKHAVTLADKLISQESKS